MGYGAPEGHGPFIAELKTYLRRVRALSEREIIVTHGSQEAIFLIAQMLLTHGQRVAVEELGYQPAFDALRASGAVLIPIRIDRDGLDPDHLEYVLRQGNIGLLYLTPLHQHPTTVTLSEERRRRIYDLACEFGFPILEDDYDHEYHYNAQPLAPFASSDPSGLVLYVSTFSKVFYPSVRLGFMAIPPGLMSQLSQFKQLVSRQNDILLQDTLARWMRAGGFERHLQKTRRHYEKRRNTLNECLTQMKVRGASISWDIPNGGMAIWAKANNDSTQIADRARKEGILIGHEFEYGVQQKMGKGLRIAFARLTPEEIKKGIDRFFLTL